MIVTGMSGAGKTAALHQLEDMGALCVDNLPCSLLPSFVQTCESGQSAVTAIGMDVRAGEFFDADCLMSQLEQLRAAGYAMQLLFLDAGDEVLINRYKETRREHPLCRGGLTLEDAIRQERGQLARLRECAGELIDTSGLKLAKLQQLLRGAVFGQQEAPSLKAEVMSFGFKRGLPREADLVLDVRFLPNPFYLPDLRLHTGQDADVRDFVLSHPVTQTFLTKTMDMLTFLLPHYAAEGKSRLVIAVGCTGGCHRSVAIAESLCASLQQQGVCASATHRDMHIEQARVKALYE